MSEQLEQRLRATKVIGFTGGGAISGDGFGTTYGGPVRALVNPDGREAADTLKRYREALAALNAHVEAMQAMTVGYLTKQDGQGDFIGNMLYMLDGPEQRAVQDQVRQALSDS